MPPLISILLPAFNAAATFLPCLRSVQRQTERRWECVIVDDGSQDATAACARSFADRDGRFVVHSTAHRGLVAALNAGLQLCRGRYIARMDADDLMHHQRLATQARALEAQPRLAAVGCHVRFFPRKDLRPGLRAYERWLNSIDSPQRVHAEAFVECPVVHPTLMIRREVLASVGYEDHGWAEDYDLILRLLASGCEIGVVPRRLLCWRDSPQRLTRVGVQCDLERLVACKAAFLSSRFLRGADRYVLWGYGSTGRALHRALLAHGKRLSHLVDVHAGRMGNTIHGARVISPGQLRHVPRRPVVVSVAGERPRRQIREFMAQLGFEESRDFVCAA